jgi:hypothetical protein
MARTIGWLTINPGIGQPRAPARARAGGALLALLALTLAACHRPPGPFGPDPRLPAAFRTPEAAFHTWRAASLAGDPGAVRACYWSGLTPEEATAYAERDTSHAARALLAGASWLGFKPHTPVEVVFRLRAASGEELRGIMVRTAAGWRLQHW